MQIEAKKIWVYFFSLCCLVLAGLSLYLTVKPTPEAIEIAKAEKIQEIRAKLSEQIGPYVLHNQWVPEINWSSDQGTEKVLVHYTLDDTLQEASERLLKSYKPDYGAIVMMDASTGKILALTSYQKNDSDAPNLALRGTFPAASLFKIVTATAALDRHNVTPDTIVMFNGGNHTLYRKNVMSTKVNKWTREMTLREAFARSINTVFGRLTLEKLVPQDLEDYAIRFGFNQNIDSDLPFDSGFTEIPKEKGFRLTELASGFNKVTRMSPIQGAMIASAIAEDGVMHVPYVVDKVETHDGRILFQAEPVTAAVTMSPEGAEKLKDLMEATITQGTSRKSFRSLVKDRKFRELVIGGKTGSLTGDNPRGKVDWFIGYAINDDQKIAVAALTVNVRYWTVKSSYLAQSLFRTHFKEEFSKENEKFFSAATERDPATNR
ncbi:MAG: penicillin-binding protein [Bdellovibrio sp. CG10_big_fil_rev_8_21_14_0_10_47_8]|nr:MAG: penicillin-binding protein [Bdellovibrio sp. CG10_big_fil_rev_8_21_14_0_10_47_8]